MDDENESIISSDIVFLKLEIIVLKNKLELLLQQNALLKNWLSSEVDSGQYCKCKCKCEDVKNKLEYYHKKKHEVQETMVNAHWKLVKQCTDAMYEKERYGN
jgi:hypothetical protein